ncbi:hypothetical protein KY284_003190 [Solanum tuberosum]|nr:hypothetical protein KY284_003190 [Solanum tuberosum]
MGTNVCCCPLRFVRVGERRGEEDGARGSISWAAGREFLAGFRDFGLRFAAGLTILAFSGFRF